MMADNSTHILHGEAAGLSFLHQQDATALSCALANLDVILGSPNPIPVQLTVSDSSANIGSFVITTSAVLFWTNTTGDTQTDLLIPGSCIDLHAILADDDEQQVPTGVYLQLSNPDDDELMELTLQPQDTSKCEEIFRAVTKLIELHPHPISDEEEDDGEDGMIMASDFGVQEAATTEERDEMLERLDRLLVVPPEYEVDNEGQFDDADEDYDLL